MRREMLDVLRCPVTGQKLVLEVTAERGAEVESGTLATPDGTRRYPIRGFIPRFVEGENYAANFGMQWLRFGRTQLDSVSGISITSDRFYRYTGWKPSDLVGKRVLDVGCGAGRFAEVARNAGAHVVALDYSAAVDACRANLGGADRIEIVQGDIYALPFSPGAFDYVYCLGVLQHTPDVGRAFRALPQQVKPGGHLAVDVYPWLWRNIMWSKYWLRPLTKRMSPERLLSLVVWATPVLLPVSRALGRTPWIGRYLRYLIPVSNYEGVYPLSESQIREWAVLDTFDMLAPEHDHPQRQQTLRRWFRDCGFDDYAVERLGFVVGRGTRPRSDSSGPGDTAANSPSRDEVTHGDTRAARNLLRREECET